MRALVLAVTMGAVAAACQSSSQSNARTGVEAAAPTTTATAVTASAPGLTAPKVDEMIRAEWTKAGITPAASVDDARYLRRVYLDVVGTIPPPEVVTSFALDPAPDKRARMVETLLASSAYAEHWATYWTDVLIGQAQDGVLDKAAFRKWLTGRFAANAPWNQLVMELLTAQGVSGEGGPRYGAGSGGMDAGAPAMMADEPAMAGPGAAVNGAVNWFVKYRDTPQDAAGSASRIFLGVQIQCAQCHDHKTEKWKQEDFRGFASCFMRTRTEPLDKDKMGGGLKRVDIVDIGRPLPRFLKNPELAVFTQAAPRALDGTDLSRAPDARQAIATWMTAPQNTWFSQAIVNRMWAHFLGRGFVNPIDDFRPSNPATAPEVLEKMASDFQAQGYDLKHLIRVITGSQAYQLSSAPRPGVMGAAAVEQAKLWPRFHLEPLGPEELLNALMDATGVEATLRATGKVDVDRIRYVLFTAYSYLFDVDEEFDQTDFEGTISQALALLNGRLVGGGTSDVPGSALDKILAQPGTDADKIGALYLRTVSRRPTPEESEYFVRYVNEPHPIDPDPPAVAPGASAPAPAGPLARLKGLKAQAQGGGKKGGPNLAGPDPLGRLEIRDAKTANPKHRAFEDVFWALLNSSEFTFNH
jgi:uncharacterized protein DUF1549/uncharacterized protein DUF1553